MTACNDKHLDFLDQLRESGKTNMLGAAPYLMKKFRNLDKNEARVILLYWMKTFPREKSGAAAAIAAPAKVK